MRGVMTTSRPSSGRAIERVRLAYMRGPTDPDAVRVIARRAIAVFEQLGSDVDLADAWQVMGIAELAARDRGAQLRALQRGRVHALASGDTRRQIESWNELGGAMLFGRTPVDEALAFLDEELVWARERGLAAVEADALLGGPYLYSRLGRFEEARERLERSKAICRELGIAVRPGGGAHGGGRDGAARGRRRGGRAGAARRDRRRDGDGCVVLRRALPHANRPRARRPGPGRGRSRRARAVAIRIRGCAEVEDRPRAGARAPRSDGGSRGPGA